MGQIANQMALELFFKIKERIKEKRSKNKPIKTMVQRNRQLPVFHMRRTHSGHCVGEICGGLTALGLCGIMEMQ